MLIFIKNNTQIKLSAIQIVTVTLKVQIKHFNDLISKKVHSSNIY